MLPTSSSSSSRAKHRSSPSTADLDPMSRIQRFLTRSLHRSKLSTLTLTPTRALLFLVLAFFALYVLWPSSIRSALSVFSPSYESWMGQRIERPDYSNWPKEKRRAAVREAFGHAYAAYERYAIPADELRPLRNSSVQNFNGWGVSMFDALDTLWLMDMKPEFERAVNYISKVEFHRHRRYDVMFFETVIRYLGGLLSAYALSGRRILLTKADELGQKLLPAFDTPSGMPAFSIDPDTGKIDLGPRDQNVVLAEIASCQMEYKYLAYLTGNRKYYAVSDRTWDWFERNQLPNGMWYTEWNITTGEMSDKHLTIGALADSAYEYLLKQYLMSGKSETRLRDMYISSMTGMIKNLLYLSPKRQILYVTDVFVRDRDGDDDEEAEAEIKIEPSRKFEHLSCFLPGLLALGVHALGDELPPTERLLHTWAAEGLAYSCWLMYAEDGHGLAPEEVLFENMEHGRMRPGGEWVPMTEGMELRRDERWFEAVERWRVGGKGASGGKPPGVPLDAGRGVARPMRAEASSERKEYFALKRKYLLRPETIESLYVMWRTTGNEMWRERGWEIFLAIEANCRMSVGYASVGGVDRRAPEELLPIDEMPSYALAETWKYLYLLFGEREADPIPMDRFVLNTEAHPFPVFKWSREEKEAFRIPG